MNRRSFLKALGFGAGAAAVAPQLLTEASAAPAPVVEKWNTNSFLVYTEAFCAPNAPMYDLCPTVTRTTRPVLESLPELRFTGKLAYLTDEDQTVAYDGDSWVDLGLLKDQPHAADNGIYEIRRAC